MILRRELVITALLVPLIGLAFGDPSDSKVTLDLHVPAAEIRAVLLRYTPIGSKAADVLNFVAARLERSNDEPVKIDNSPATGLAAAGSHRRGMRRIRAYLGEYYQQPGAVFLSAPMIMRKRVRAQWAFGEHDRLIDIFVDKRTSVY
jgi:hypothetical protein